MNLGSEWQEGIDVRQNIAVFSFFSLDSSCEYDVGEFLDILGTDVCKYKCVCFYVLTAASILYVIPMRTGTSPAYCCFQEVNSKVL